jgi:hypothetical protein
MGYWSIGIDASGYSGKILSKQPVKTIGLQSLGPVLQCRGHVRRMLESPAARL